MSKTPLRAGLGHIAYQERERSTVRWRQGGRNSQQGDCWELTEWAVMLYACVSK